MLNHFYSINEITWLKNDAVIIDDFYVKNYSIIKILVHDENEEKFNEEFPQFLYRNIKR